MSQRVNRKQRFLIFGMVALVAFLIWGTSGGLSPKQQDPTWARCQREGVLRVGMDASYPPFEVEQGGVFQGYDVDLAHEIGLRLGLRVTFVNVHFDGLYDALLAKRCDLLISALPYDGSRTQEVIYTGGYFNAGQVIVARQQDENIQSPADLSGRCVAVEMGSQGHLEARRLRERQRINLTIKAAQSSDQAFALLQSGEVDAVIADAITAALYLRAHPDAGLALRGVPLTDESFVIATRRDSPQLFAAVNRTLNDLRGSGWLDTLADRWLGPLQSTASNRGVTSMEAFEPPRMGQSLPSLANATAALSGGDLDECDIIIWD